MPGCVVWLTMFFEVSAYCCWVVGLFRIAVRELR
jgi:hypothetical protein